MTDLFRPLAWHTFFSSNSDWIEFHFICYMSYKYITYQYNLGVNRIIFHGGKFTMGSNHSWSWIHILKPAWNFYLDFVMLWISFFYKVSLYHLESWLCFLERQKVTLMVFIKPNLHKYRKVVSSNTSRLEAHAGFFKLLMKGIFDPYVLWPFVKKLIF